LLLAVLLALAIPFASAAESRGAADPAARTTKAKNTTKARKTTAAKPAAKLAQTRRAPGARKPAAARKAPPPAEPASAARKRLEARAAARAAGKRTAAGETAGTRAQRRRENLRALGSAKNAARELSTRRSRRKAGRPVAAAPAAVPLLTEAVAEPVAPAPAPAAASAPAPAASPKAARPKARRGNFLSRAFAPAAPVTLTAGVPPGFEEFLKPQRTLVDIYFGGIPLGTVMAEYTPDGITFLRPEEVAERIPNALDRGELAHRLQGRLERNSDLACLGGRRQGCGRLEPEVIGVIFDEDRFRADVFVHPDKLAVRESGVNRYLPPPADPDATSLVQNLTAVMDRDSRNSDSHTVSGNTWIGRGTDHVFAQWYHTQRQDLAVDQLAWRRDLPDHSYTAGLFEARNDDLNFAQSALLAGAGAGRSLKRRTDIADESATRLQVFLDTRSSVQIYRDGRLLNSQFYDPGNQVLDTSNLPYGSYDIVVRIVDAAGVTRTQTQFFIKTTQLAPPGEPQWYVEGGQVLRRSRESTLPEDADTLQLRGGWRDRLRENLGYSVAGAAVATHALAESSLTWLHPRYSASGGLMASTQGDSGWTTMANGRWGQLSGGLGLRYTHAAKAALDSADDYQLVAGDSFSRSLMLNYPVAGGQLSGSVYSNRTGGAESDIYALRYLRNLQLGYFPPIFLNAQISKADDDLVASVGLDMNGFGEHWNWRLSPGLRHREPALGDASDTAGLAAGAGWRDGSRWAEDVEAGLHTTIEETATTVGADARYASGYGRLQASVDHIQNDTADSQRYNARYETNLVATTGHAAFGGQHSAASSVLMDLRSAPADAEFDVYINGRQHAALHGGRQVPLLLPPYHSYELSLADRGASLLHFDATPRTVTLYPGSVAALEYQVERVVVAFGRILRRPPACATGAEDCTLPVPLPDARLRGISGLAMTESDGSFQAELVTGTRQLSAVKNGVECTAELPEPRWASGILLLGDLDCRVSATTAAAPETPAVADAVPASPVTASAATAPAVEDATPVPAGAALVAAPDAAATVAAGADSGAVPAAPAASAPKTARAPGKAGAGRKGAAGKKAATAKKATVGKKAAASPRKRASAAAAKADPRRLAEERRRRERLRRLEKRVEKSRAEIAIQRSTRPGKARPQPVEKPLDRRERLKRNAEKVDRLLLP
jgi:hypothetical protein